MKLYQTLSLLALLAFFDLSFGQVPEKDRKKQTSVLMKKLNASDTSSLLNLPEISFDLINTNSYFRDEGKLAQIERFRKNKQWRQMQHLLIIYVSQFGPENFVRDLDLIWKLARLAEYNNNLKLAKEMYRLIFKHFRGNVNSLVDHQTTLKQAFLHYDSLVKFEKPLYTDLEYYYKMVEKRKLIDTLRPPRKVLTDLGEEINSPFDDYGLTICGENNDIMLFSSDRNQDSATILRDAKPLWINEDIFISRKDSYGDWTAAEPLDDINTNYNEGSPCMTRDGQTLFFARCFSPDGMGDCDLYFSKLMDNGKWGKAVNMSKSVNSTAWESHPALSKNEDTLYFSSSRIGGFGGTDIYFSVKDSITGKWGKAMNLGPIINTRGSEVSPFPHPKYEVLYFSSNGHLINFGDFDIYKTFNLNGKLTEPYNVGPLVNGPGSEFYFTIDSDSKLLYYAKTQKSRRRKSLDLMSFPLPMEAQPNATVRFTGQIVEPRTGEVFKGRVTIIDVYDGIEIMPKMIDSEGKFYFDLINNKQYLLVVEGDNFFKIEELFYVDGSMEVQVPATSVNSVITFESIDFKPNSFEILPEMENNLHLVIDFLQNRALFNLVVTGHTDSDGSPETNQKLSLERAKAIKNYIVTVGDIDEKRIRVEGKGNSQPLIKVEKSEADKKKNRRVEFKIFRVDEYDEPEKEEPKPILEEDSDE
jgi:outer membrane protein OmpA-like peptidoglycan-associated protein